MIEVLNKRVSDRGEYVGRPSVLGNPFVVGEDGTRDECVDRYLPWLREQWRESVKVRKELKRLHRIYRKTGRLSLVCWCAPARCHAEVIRWAIMKMEMARKTK